MVNVMIFVEGGALPNSNVPAETANNSERLRESFYHLFAQLLPPSQFNLMVRQGGGNHQTTKFFKKRMGYDPNAVLLIDLDAPSEDRSIRIVEFRLGGYRRNVFFMVQEMEGWIISQVDKIDVHYRHRYLRKKPEVLLSEDEVVADKHPGDIPKPSRVLRVLLRRYFAHLRREHQPKNYHKLKDGAELLAILDAEGLAETFDDFDQLVKRIRELAKQG